jgi:hypothetical protein
MSFLKTLIHIKYIIIIIKCNNNNNNNKIYYINYNNQGYTVLSASEFPLKKKGGRELHRRGIEREML